MAANNDLAHFQHRPGLRLDRPTDLQLESPAEPHQPSPSDSISEPLTPIANPQPSTILPPPTHFLSGASQRLTELQHHLHLNPDHPPTPPAHSPPSELDPLLSCRPSQAHPRPYPLPASQHANPTPRQVRPTKSPRKMGTFDGVYLPTILSIFNVIYFLRFGYCIGHIGLLPTLALLLLAYAINTLTVFSLSAIATNGQVRGGGAYCPEFGGSIGILFCLNQALTASMNIIGFVESALSITQLRLPPTARPPPSFTLAYLLKTAVLLSATWACIGLGRTKIFSSMARSMASILLLTLFTILISFANRKPFEDPARDFVYTGFSLQTLRSNFLPTYADQRPSLADYQRIFGIIFPSVSGILAGSSLSGELRKPSRSLPNGILTALGSVIIVYLLSLLGLSSSVARETLRTGQTDGSSMNLIVYQISTYPTIISLGLLLSAIFSSIMAITVCGKILQAVSRDGLIPILKPFFSQGSQIGDDPVYSILFCCLLCQLALVYTINKIAIHITTISLLIFASINLACFTLRIAGSPNFRPSFRLFSEWTAGLGLILAFVSMYAVDPVSASSSLIVMMVLFTVIHYSSPAKQWGEVTQSIIYHQVRKYLLRLDERKDNVKYWRPQVLLFTNDPRHDWNQIVFCNSLKKGGLYVLAHIIKSEFSAEAIQELQEQQLNWLSLVDISNIKAFVDITVAPDERVGARHLLLTSGLGGMRPNVCILGFPTNNKWRRRGKLATAGEELPRRRSDSSITVRGLLIESEPVDVLGSLPTDSQRPEPPIRPTDFVGIIEDSLGLNKSVGLTFGFERLRLPGDISKPKMPMSASLGGLAGLGIPLSASLGGLASLGGQADEETEEGQGMHWIELWPILRDGESGWETYTMVLQLGTILSMVPSWRTNHGLRVTIFCEHENEIGEERRRMEKLLADLRIRAVLRVCVLGCGKVMSYECLVKGKEVDGVSWAALENALGGDPWWETLKFMRAQDGPQPKPGGGVSSAQKKKKPMDRSLVTKHSQTNNIRIKALHPFSRRSSSEPGTEGGLDAEALGEDEEDLMLDENDGDDDTVARDAYRKQHSRGKGDRTPGGLLPDEPLVVGADGRGRIDYGSMIEHQSLDLNHQSLDLNHLTLSPRELWNDPRPTPHRARHHSRQSSASSSRTSSTSTQTFRNFSNSHRPNNPRPSIRIPQPQPESVPEAEATTVLDPVVELDFNSLPMRAQLVCLNELIRLHSGPDSAIIFTSLPPPEEGCSKSYQSSARYLDEIECFLERLPPVVAIYAKQFTVTFV
ncbi:hypothetical protein CROQUDRAFT_94964 [Cronartium quercuum f. sp. fusiforme G11]|uniref:Uncharacterized protein n=1 Tax=Cronartium quercuum f. sp. fusiforme G11 TaxID=708437 RepID=A0A9P6T9V2_9BASI|nr:hypothetical protein CROQUDRAFT_94964 [Cronartium quercuum f. sp. fusiforme G11]